MRTVYAILGLGVIPGAVICAGIYICRSQDPNRLALKAAIKSVNNHVIHVKLLAKAKEINEIELTRRKQKLGLEVESTKQRRKPKGDVAPAKQKSKKPKQMNILETLGSAASSFRNLLSPAQEGLEPSRKSTAL